jgi:hypothetical protein
MAAPAGEGKPSPFRGEFACPEGLAGVYRSTPPDIADATAIPHPAVLGAPGDGSFDLYEFTVPAAGVTGYEL